MPKKIQQVTKAHLVSVPLPNHGASYTVISHQFVIDYAYQALANAGFGIVDEQYRCTADGQIATGIYRLQFNNDPELSMMFAWTNSYNKQVKFQCVIGAHINTTGAVMISGNIGSWVRKHTGTADTETKEIIDNYINNAYMYYNQLVADKAAMEQVTLNIRRQSQLLGVLFAEYEILTTEQASIVRSQMSRPSVSFNNQESLWAFYNYVTIALQSSHPKTWLEDQRILHYFISTICDFSKPISQPVPAVSEPVEEEVVDPLYEVPNQTNILDQIADLEADQIDEDIRYAAAEEESLLAAQHPVTEEEALSITLDETIEYTDPQGNTFEAPVVQTKAPQEFIDALMNAPEIDASEVDMSKVTWVDAPETVKEVEDKPKLSLDDILIRIPNQIKEEAEMMQVSENQVVQNTPENDTDLHQLQNDVLDVNETIEDSLDTIEADLTELETESELGKNGNKIQGTNFPEDDSFSLDDFSDNTEEEDNSPDFF
jgi:hypothetical protein